MVFGLGGRVIPRRALFGQLRKDGHRAENFQRMTPFQLTLRDFRLLELLEQREQAGAVVVVTFAHIVVFSVEFIALEA